ncbi:hypothetical protein BDV09DRAFT_204523 [Aspergillus tetrazonus]
MYNAVHPQEAPQQMPQIRAVGSVASPILLPISGTGPVPLSLTLASDNASPNASSAFSVIPISMDVEEGAPQPEFRNIQPWDLKHPVAVYANRDGRQLPVFYDAATQEYYLFTIEGAVLLHKTPTLTIKKEQARQVLGRITYSHFGRFTETELVERIMKDIDLPFSSSPLVDSVSDKDVRESGTWGSDRWLTYLRPSLDGLVGHRCDALWHCTSTLLYSISSGIMSSTAPNHLLPFTLHLSYIWGRRKTDNTLTFGQPIPVGRVTIVAHIARKIFDGCLRPDKKSLNIPRAYQILSKIFHKPTIDSIPIPQAYMVSNLLRDSLLVGAGMFPKTAAESWADCFDGEHSQHGMSGMTKAAVGVAAGTAVVGTGAMVGLKIAEVVGV